MDKMKSLLNKNKLVLLVLSVITLLLIIGTSLAFYQMVNTQTGENLVETGCFDVRITNQENAINLENAYPISDEKGKSLTPFTFTLANNCNVTGKYTVNLEVLKDSTMSTSFVKTMVNNGIISKLDALPKADTKNSGSIEARTIATGILTPNSTVDYSVSLWMDENVTIEDGAMGTVLKSKIVVVSTPTDIKPKTEEIIAELDKTGKCPTVNEDGTVTVTDTEDTTGYLCSAPDNYGTSYYYRGNVEKNYVKLGRWSDNTPDIVYGFYNTDSYDNYRKYESIEDCKASSYHNNNCTLVSRKGKDMYWRIVRINGDGTIRLVYDGTKTLQNNLADVDKVLINKDYDFTKYHKYVIDNASSGYMHGEITEVVKSSKTSKATLDNSKTYYLSNEYVDDEWYFMLKDPISITSSDIDEKYIGYYITDNYTSAEYGLKEINNINKTGNSIEFEYHYISHGTTSKEQAQTNKIDSYTKENVDEWYKNNILGTSVEQYITDEIFCSDRTISNVKYNDNYTNLGYGSEPTVYRFGENIVYNNETGDINLNSTIKIKFICSQKNDSFTVNNLNNGNRSLTYPVGLLSLDENILNNTYGATSNSLFGPIFKYEESWMFSPYDMESPNITPVINVKASTLLYGDGTASNPYRPIE